MRRTTNTSSSQGRPKVVESSQNHFTALLPSPSCAAKRPNLENPTHFLLPPTPPSQHAALAPAREKVPHNKHLQPRNAEHEQILNHAEPEDALFRAAHRAKVAVLARPKVLLVARNRRQLPGELVDGFLQVRGLLGGRALLGGEGRAGFIFNLGAVRG